MCTVVLKLFNLVQPDVAVFGKKDRQQLKIVRGMVQSFNMPIQIVPAETVRAEDGLALASRNTYLTPAERAEAPNLYRVLREIADAIAAGRHDYANLEAAGRMELAHRGWKVDYVAVRHGLALRIPHPEGYDHPNLLIVLAAATLGTTRLIDNVDVIKKGWRRLIRYPRERLAALDAPHSRVVRVRRGACAAGALRKLPATRRSRSGSSSPSRRAPEPTRWPASSRRSSAKR